jgi:hypothetical protein
MAIFTKDGKVYVVEGPNPLVEKQVSWDPSRLVFHNFEWDEISQEASRSRRSRPPKKAEETRGPSATATIEIPVREEKEKEADEHPVRDESLGNELPDREEKEPEAEDERPFDLPYIKYKVLCHCLPARLEQRKDSLYGESWGRVKYGNKFVFPCVVTSSSDLSLEFWTSDPRSQITERSIVYPFTYEVHNRETDAYDRVPYDDYRWWRVSSKEEKEGGWLFRANPSDFQPDFSD